MNDTDKMLIGTAWKRTAGNHNPISGTIDAVNITGPRLKLADGSHRRLKWIELGFGWQPEDTRSSKRFELYTLARRVDYLDKKEIELTKLESELQKVENGSAPIMTEPEVAVKECHGAWHRHDRGKNGVTWDLVPLNQFSIATHGINKGKLGSVCDSCKEKTNRAPSHKPKGTKPGPKKRLVIQPIPAPVKIEPGVVIESGEIYRWKVTVIQVSEEFVQAKDLLDIAAQFEGRQVTKVEKL